MKKISVLLLAVLLGTLVCFPAFADMGGPMMIGYSVTLSHETDYYDWVSDEGSDESGLKKAGTIPAGTELQIENEYEMNGVNYGVFTYGSDEDRVNGYVRLADLKQDVGKAPEFTSAYKQGLAVRLCVTDPKGITLYAGPSGVYNTVGTIPAGTELTVDTLDQKDYDEAAWMYVTHGKQTGWARCWLYEGTYCPMAELLPDGSTGTLWVVKDNAALCDRDGKEIIKVPKGEKLTFDSFNRSPHVISYYVTYQGKTGVFTVDDDGYDNFVASNKNDYTAYRSMKLKQPVVTGLYAYPEDRMPSGTIAFGRGETVSADYLYYAEPLEGFRGGVEWYHVEKNGKSGWVKIDGDKLAERDGENNSVPDEIPNLNNYDGRFTQEKIVIPAPAVATKAASATTTTTAAATTEAAVVPVPTAEITEPAAPAETTTEDGTAYAQFETTEASTEAFTPAPAPKRPIPPIGIIAMCVGGAGVLSLTALVTMRLIRRKKELE